MTVKSKTSPKPTATPKSAVTAKAAANKKTQSPSRVKPDAAGTAANGAAQMKKADLLDQIVARTTLKKRDAKAAIDAALAILSEAVARGDELILPPLGKIRVIKSKDLGDGAAAVTLKLRSSKDASQIDKTSLATAGNDD